MDSVAGPNPGELLRLARDGEENALGQLLEGYRSYLTLFSRLQVDRRLQGKVNPSDLVQETFMEAHRAFGGFRGTSEGEVLQWLRRILATRLAKLVRRFYGTQGRDVRLERQLDDELDQSSQMANSLVVPQSSPSGKAARREQAVLLADALEQLPADYREVIVLRHFEELSFPQVAQRLGRSEDSVKKTWARGLAALRRSLGGKADDPL